MAVDRGGSATGPDMWRKESRFVRVKEQIYKYLLMACAYFSILTTAGIVFVLFFETINFFRFAPEAIGEARDSAYTGFNLLLELFTTTNWRTGFANPEYGMLPLIWGTIQITIIAMIVALPLGLMAAIFLSEYAPTRVRQVLKPALEVLAGVPTVVYGFFALTFVTPLLQQFIPGLLIFNSLSAGLVMGVMIIPTVASISEDSIYAVPQALREGAYALGATKFEVSTRVVVPAALSGIVAAFVLGVARAVGETIIVAVAAGNLASMSPDPRLPHQTMTAYIVQVTGGETAAGTTTYQTIFVVGATLFLITLVLNIISNWFARRYKEVYE